MKFDLLNKINSSFDSWLTSPEKNAAEKMGLFRIIYSIFYLWYLSNYFGDSLGYLPRLHGYAVPVLVMLFPPSIPSAFFQLAESVLVTALIMLVFGLRVKLATYTVLLIGCILESFYIVVEGEHSTIFLVFYIPLFLSIFCCWGDTYSLDAMLKKSKSKLAKKLDSSHWTFSLPGRCILIILATLFFSSALYKVGFGGTWLINRDLIAEFAISKNISAAKYGLPLNYLAPYIARTPIVYETMRLTTLLFEGLFFLALFNWRLRNLFLSIALIFHTVNALVFGITFSPILIVYGIFIDWQVPIEKISFEKLSFLRKIPLTGLTSAALFTAVAIGIIWNQSSLPRTILNLGGLINWRTICYPTIILAATIFFITLKGISTECYKFMMKLLHK